MNEKDSLLNQIRDVEAPSVATYIAPGWWLLLLLVAVGLVLLWFAIRRHRVLLWQRQAQALLDSIQANAGSVSTAETLAKCSALSRQIVLAVDERENVASLHGQLWLDKLDAVCGRPEFSQGVGQLLVNQPYQPNPSMGEDDLAALLDSMQVLVSSARRYKPAKQLHGQKSAQAGAVESKP